MSRGSVAALGGVWRNLVSPIRTDWKCALQWGLDILVNNAAEQHPQDTIESHLHEFETASYVRGSDVPPTSAIEFLVSTNA